MATATARQCDRCHADLPAGSSVNRQFCDRCRTVRRILTFLHQARALAEAMDYDASLSAAIRVAVKRANHA